MCGMGSYSLDWRNMTSSCGVFLKIFLAHGLEWHDLVNPRQQFDGYVKVQEAHQLRAISWESTSQLLRMSLGTSLLPCYTSYSCILREISSSVEIQQADGYFSNYMFTNYQGGFETSSLFWFDCCVCTHRFPRTYTFPLCDMSEIRSDMYAGASTGHSGPRAWLSGLNSRSCPGVHVWLYT